MSSNKNLNKSKDNFVKSKVPLCFSPYTNKIYNIDNLYTEPRHLNQDIDSKFSKNQIKQKINSNINKNIINIKSPDTFKKNAKILSEIQDKINQSYKKKTKLNIKKNDIPNISSINDTNSNGLSTQTNTGSNSNIYYSSNDSKDKFMSNKLTNIKFNIGKSSQNFLNQKNSSSNLKRNAGSAYELGDINNLNLNQLGYIYTFGNKQKSFLSPQNNNYYPKIIMKNEKNKTKDNFYEQNISKDSKEKNNINIINDKNKQINISLRNNFTNMKIYPTSFLNNEIIYNKNDKNNKNKSNIQISENKKCENINNSSMHYNNSKIKKEIIYIESSNKESIINNENFNSIEELHYFYVNTLQKGKKYAIKLDKCNN